MFCSQAAHNACDVSLAPWQQRLHDFESSMAWLICLTHCKAARPHEQLYHKPCSDDIYRYIECYAMIDMQDLSQAREQVTALQGQLDSSGGRIHAAEATAEVHRQRYEDDLQRLRNTHAQALSHAQADAVAANDQLNHQVAICSDVWILPMGRVHGALAR
jgi:hypothetical protein